MPTYALTVTALCAMLTLAAVHVLDGGADEVETQAPVFELDTEAIEAPGAPLAARPAPRRRTGRPGRRARGRQPSLEARRIEQYRGPDAPPLVSVVDEADLRDGRDDTRPRR